MVNVQVFVLTAAHTRQHATDLDAVEVEDVGAAAKGDGEPVLVVGRGVGLRLLYYWVHGVGKDEWRVYVRACVCEGRQRQRPQARTDGRTDGSTHLVLDGGLVEVVAADGARVGADVPGPHRYGVPLLDLEARRCIVGWV